MTEGRSNVSAGQKQEQPDERPSSLLARLKVRARALRRRFRGTEDESLVDRVTSIDEDYVERGAEDVSEVDLDTVVERADAIEERFQTSGPLQRLLRDGRLLLGLVRDARRGHYREVPVWTLSAAGFTLLYVLNPFDIVPDTIPLLGLLDDAAVVSACLSLVEQDLREYQAWKQSNAAEIEDGGTTDASEDPISS
jgi:uncharacterized membrane protein YkvA (DUF1232 family)